jgi:hypothetical protein
VNMHVQPLLGCGKNQKIIVMDGSHWKHTMRHTNFVLDLLKVRNIGNQLTILDRYPHQLGSVQEGPKKQEEKMQMKKEHLLEEQKLRGLTKPCIAQGVVLKVTA